MGKRTRIFQDLVQARAAAGFFTCVGLDTEATKIPTCITGTVSQRTHDFNRAIVEATGEHAGAFKPNIAFYEGRGSAGITSLKRTVAFIRRMCPWVPIILDFKRADIGNTNRGYVQLAFEELGVDAVTVSPYLGGKALEPFLEFTDKGIFVLCRTSNEGANEFQNLDVLGVTGQPGTYMPLYQYVAQRVTSHWNNLGNCGLVVGATAIEELSEVRGIAQTLPILIPGIGAQGGDLEASVKVGMTHNKDGFIINSSRGIIFASSGDDFGEAANKEILRLNAAINQYRLEGR